MPRFRLPRRRWKHWGSTGGLWTTTISYDAGDINTANLKQYDAIFLDSTTACFLDDKDAVGNGSPAISIHDVRQERQRCRRNPCGDGLIPYKLLAAQVAASRRRRHRILQP